ncbi:hypothetical protein DFJ74DRAFT_704323 [Hyaloraphidium curvatum]|nr:hypothetical protein DFJ74DRAFT_704323 [Hyaloraphidium curvatum]
MSEAFAVPAPVSPVPSLTLEYSPPAWSAVPDGAIGEDGRPPAAFEVIRSGVAVGECPLASRGKPFLVVGRVPTCDVELEHPSVSRLHAVVQFGAGDAVMLFDLGSAHGTFVNKIRAPPRTYVELHEGDQVRFGASTRVFVLLGRTRDRKPAEPNGGKPVVLSGEEAHEAAMARPAAAATTAEELHTVTWGFDEDAAEEGAGPGEVGDGEAPEIDEDAYYVRDPRKALRVWTEERGLQMEFEHEEDGKSHEKVYMARVRLPLGEHGSLVGVGTSSRKKDAEREACLDACAKLDRKGLLRSNEAGAGRKRKGAEVDDDTDDNFYDRSAPSKKKLAQAKAAKAGAAKVETFETLTAKKAELVAELALLDGHIAEARRAAAEAEASQKDDDLDSYFAQVKVQELKANLLKLDAKRASLVKDIARTEKLLDLAKPIDGFPGASKNNTPAVLDPSPPVAHAPSFRAPAPAKEAPAPEPANPSSIASHVPENVGTLEAEREQKPAAPPSSLTERDDPSPPADDVVEAPQHAQRNGRLNAFPVEEEEGSGGSLVKLPPIEFETPSDAPKKPRKRNFGPSLPAGKPAQKPPSYGVEEDEVVDAVQSKRPMDVQAANSAYGY